MKKLTSTQIVVIVLFLAGAFLWFLGSPVGNDLLRGKPVETTTESVHPDEAEAGIVESTRITNSPGAKGKERSKSTATNSARSKPVRSIETAPVSYSERTATKAIPSKVKPVNSTRSRKESGVVVEREASGHAHFASKSDLIVNKPSAGTYWVSVNGRVTSATIPINIGAPYSEPQIDMYARLNSEKTGLTTAQIRKNFFQMKGGKYYPKCRAAGKTAEFVVVD